jgi:ABC-2 type transport system permease protein
MRKILTLLKYASTMASMAGGMGTSGSRRGFKYMGLITSLIMLLALGLPMFFFGLSTLRSLAIPLTSVNIPLPGYLSDMVLALGLISGALFFFLSYSPSVAFNLFGSPDIELLLTFPLKRSQIFLYKAIDSLALGSVGIAVVLPLLFAYAIAMGHSWLLALLASVIFLVFFWALSLLVAALLSRLMSGQVLKRFAILLYLLTIVGFVAIMQLLPRASNNLKEILAGMQGFFQVIYSPFLFTRWFLDLFQGHLLGYAVFALAIPALLWLTIWVSNRLAFQAGASMRTRAARFATHSARWPVFQRDLQLLVREPMNLYGFIYPVALSLVMLFVNAGGAGSLIALGMTIFLAAFFAAMTTATLLREERKSWPTPLLFPLTLRELLAPKLWLPAFFFLVAYLLVALIAILAFQASLWILLTLPIALAISLFCSHLGARFYIQRPIVTSRNYFTVGVILLLELLTLILSVLTILPFFLWVALQTAASIPTMPGWLAWAVTGPGSLAWGFGLPFLVTAILLIVSLRGQRSLARKMTAWEA